MEIKYNYITHVCITVSHSQHRAVLGMEWSTHTTLYRGGKALTNN